MLSLIRLKRRTSTTSTACRCPSIVVDVGAFDFLGECQAIGKPGEAVAEHFGAQRSLRLDLDGPVDEAHQATRRASARASEAAPA